MSLIPTLGLGIEPPIGRGAGPLSGNPALNGQAFADGTTGLVIPDMVHWRISNAEILALAGAGATTVLRTLTPAAGQLIVPFHCLTEANSAAGAYGGGGANSLGLRYQNTDAIGAFITHPVGQMWNAGAADHYVATWALSSTLNNAFVRWTLPLTPYAQPLELIITLPGAAFAGGNGNNYWRFLLMFYRIGNAAAPIIS